MKTISAPDRRIAAMPANRIEWPRALVYGLLWGLAIMVAETFVQPLDAKSLSEWLWFEFGMLQWAVAGIGLASATMLLEYRLRSWMIAPALIAFSLLVSAGWWQLPGRVWMGRADAARPQEGSVESASGNSPLAAPLRPGYDRRPYFSTWFDGAGRVHIFWGAMVYGGLFVAAYRLSMQSERTRQLLARAEIARQETENLLSEAQLLSLQGHIEPAFLFRAMVEVEHRYAHDAAGMARLLDPLISFLRAAMPGVRSGASTLAAEVSLAEQYAQVWAELEPARATWNVQIEGTLPDLPFPPLLLLPVLDQLAAGASAQRIDLQLSQIDGPCVLTLISPTPGHELRLTPELLYRLQVGLRAVFGHAWKLQITPGYAQYVLTLPRAPTASAVPTSSLPLFSPAHQEITHG